MSVFQRSDGYNPNPPGGRPAVPRAVKVLLVTNGIMFVLQQFAGRDMIMLLGLTPARVLEDLALYQLVTYMFLHGGLFHILVNMFVLWMFGSEIEWNWGSVAFLRYYFLTGLAGGVCTVAFQPHAAVPTIGASGAIYGLLVAYALMFPDRTIYLYFLFPLKVKYAVIIFVVLEFLASLSANADGVGHLAHLGGAAVGFAYLKLGRRWRRRSGISSFRQTLENLRWRRKTAKINKNRQEAEEVMKRVDRILDRINEVGIENITEEERRFLDDASDILSKKGK